MIQVEMFIFTRRNNYIIFSFSLSTHCSFMSAVYLTTYIGNQTHGQLNYGHRKPNASSNLLLTPEIKRIVNYYVNRKSNASSILLLTPESNRIVSSFYVVFFRYKDMSIRILIQKVYWKSNTSVCNLWIHHIPNCILCIILFYSNVNYNKNNANSLFCFNVVTSTWFFLSRKQLLLCRQRLYLTLSSSSSI